jgi:phosphatidylserine decarboxylase
VVAPDRNAPAGPGDQAFATLQRVLPKQLLSRQMHALARSTRPALRNLLVGSVLRAYPQIDMSEAVQSDPYAYPSFNAFFTRALRPEARPIDRDPKTLVSPVDGTLSEFGALEAGRLLQAKGIRYGVAELLGDPEAEARYRAARFACIYLAPYNYHRIHMPVDGTLLRSRYVPGELFSVNAATARSVQGLFARNERVVSEFDTRLGPLALVLVGALFVGSIETVWGGEANPPPLRGGAARALETGQGHRFAKGEEIARFNMGSTVIAVLGDPAAGFARDCAFARPLRLGQALLHSGERD